MSKMEQTSSGLLTGRSLTSACQQAFRRSGSARKGRWSYMFGSVTYAKTSPRQRLPDGPVSWAA